MTDKYAVIGNPISHSKSPEIHRMFAEQTSQDLEYEKLFSEIDSFEKTVTTFFERGGKGLNVTVPFKLDAYKFADNVTDLGKHAGAINTLILNSDGTVTGENTDGTGFIKDACGNNGFNFKNKNVLIIGAGGAVRGILRPIIANEPASLSIANRTKAKAADLLSSCDSDLTTHALSLDELCQDNYDIIINGSSAGLTDGFPDLNNAILKNCDFAYDLVYGKEKTAFIKWVESKCDAKTADGLGMLVEQAAVSFYCWRGKMPKTDYVITKLRDALQ